MYICHTHTIPNGKKNKVWSRNALNKKTIKVANDPPKK